MRTTLKKALRAAGASSLMLLVIARAAVAAVLAYGLDTSGSMRGNRFEAARAALIREFDALRPGDVALIFTFDVVARGPLGRISVAEDGSAEGRDELEHKINALKPRGLYTNLDEIVSRLKLAVFEERTPGDRRVITVVSDGLSDPDAYHQRVNLAALGEMVPQNSGIALYLISLPEDLTKLFGAPLDATSGIVSAPELPHIKGIAFNQSSTTGVADALEKVHEPTATPTNTSTHTVTPTATATSTPTLRASATPSATVPQTTAPPLSSAPVIPWVIGALALAAVGVSLPVLRRHGETTPRAFALEVTDGDAAPKRVPLAFDDRTKVTVGPRGDVPLSDPDLPAVVFTMTWNQHQLWLTPLDSVAINGQPATRRTAVGPGDVITVRTSATIRIDEGDGE